MIWGCSKPPSGYRLYYFPYDELETPKVYTYRNVENFNDVWYYSVASQIGEKKTLIHIDIFDSKLNQTESILMKVENTGVFAEEYECLVDSVQMKMKIYADTIFLWDMNENSKFMFESSINRPETRNLCVKKKVRTFVGESDKFVYEGVDYKTIIIDQDEYYNDGTDALTLQKTSYTFARGLGIVSFVRNEKNEKEKRYELKSIEPYNIWEKYKDSQNNKVIL
jgi:hypothetical protein